jgi:riboflavin-specific deaminase-like protein
LPTTDDGRPNAPDAIWDFLVSARNHDWTVEPTLNAPMPGVRLQLHRSGDWQADTALDDSAAALLDVLGPIATAERIVVAQLGQSLDGRIATRTGHSQYINGPVALAHLHRLRALVDAVLVGAGTACADLPQLTVRNVTGPNPVPVIVDPRARVDAVGPLFEEGSGPHRVLQLIADDAAPSPAPAHVERVRLPLDRGRFSPASILDALAERALQRLLVEGGADTVSGFMHADALDRIHLLIAPLIIGSGRNGLDLPAIDRLDEARRPRIRTFRLEDELLVDVILREPALD